MDRGDIMDVKFDRLKIKTKDASSGKEVLLVDFCGRWFCEEKGKVIALMGRSGVGKSCFVKILAGLADSGVGHAGSITIDGVLPSKYLSSGNLGMAFQMPMLVPWLTVRENIAISDRHKKDFVDSLIDWLHLGCDANTKAGDCSGGQQHRTSFARALAHEPSLLILDEPFTGIDLLTKEHIMNCIVRHEVLKKKLVLLITHDIQEVSILADELWVLSQRKISKLTDTMETDFKNTEYLKGRVLAALEADAKPCPT